jgi:hypothetical protein
VAVGTGLLCVALTGCGHDGAATADATTASASILASAPPTSVSASPPEPTSSVSDVPTPVPASTDERATAAPSEEPVAVDTSGVSSLWGKRYSGTSNISVDIYDYCTTDGSRHLAGSQTYSMNGTLDLSRPRTGGGETESNPFSMLFAAGDPAQAGAVSFRSSAISTTSGLDLAGNPRDPNLLLTYWGIDWSDGELAARLTDPHAREGVPLNLFNWSSPVIACHSELGRMPGGFPHELASGTTFGGRLDGSTASLTAKGGTVDGMVAFRFTYDGMAS